jgi:hypothetical protein
MRLSSFVSAALVLSSMSVPAFAQEYVEYASRQDGFTITFPVQPTITETTVTSQYGSVLPARIYTADSATGHYAVTVVDYNNIHAIATEKAKTCPPGAETCLGTESDVSSTGRGYWKADLSGATLHAIWTFLQRDAKVTFLGWATMDLVEGTVLSLTNNKDKSHTSAGIYMHENKLYLLEGTVPAAYPPPDWFQQNVGWIDENGNPIRYLSVYHNGYPKPEVARRGARGQGAGGVAR